MKLAVVQVRGIVGLNRKFKDSLKFLNLFRKNSCAVVDESPTYIGALVKLKDYVTWGEIDLETFSDMIKKRGRIVGNKLLSEDYLKSKINLDYDTFTKNFFEGKIKLRDVPGLKRCFRLTPPRGGYEREGIKKQYSVGGALGYRGKDINNLIRRML